MLMKNELGRQLKRIRESKGRSLDDLAQITHIASRVLWTYEEGSEIPKKPKLHLIARALGCDVRNLLISRQYSLAAKRTNRIK